MNHGQTAIKVIVFMGVLSFVFLALIAGALKRTLAPNLTEQVHIRQKYSPFDGARAMRELEAVIQHGPRHPGSPAAAQTREYLKKELQSAGLRVWQHAFEAQTPDGPIELVNLVAVSEGARPEVLLFGTAYDTVQQTEPFLGANEGGSTTAWMLEWARALGPRRDGRTCWFVWFDGETLPAKDTATDGLHGSRAFVQRTQAAGELANIQAAVFLRAIGDCYLRISEDAEAPGWLRSTLSDIAERLRYRAHFDRPVARSEDGSHTAFRSAGVPTLLLADTQYGGSPVEHQRLWRTPEDGIEHVCRESLQAVADVLYHALPAIEGRLETPGIGAP